VKYINKCELLKNAIRFDISLTFFFSIKFNFAQYQLALGYSKIIYHDCPALSSRTMGKEIIGKNLERNGDGIIQVLS
jgi:hypothetical protein